MKMKIYYASKLTHRVYSIIVEGETLSDCIAKGHETYDHRDYYLGDWEYWEV